VLNSIGNFIWNNEPKKAAEYLSKFSRLNRLVLENLHSETVSLKNDLEALENYIALEALRLDGKMSYEIRLNLKQESDQIQVIPMVVQPFVENAILHGIYPKAGNGTLVIEINQEQDQLLHIVVTDDGVGRKKGKSTEEKERQSLGIQITISRLKKINPAIETPILFQDLVDDSGRSLGTRVDIYLPADSEF
jgi:LytS/YehU family sensor histidine kinase